MGNLVLKVVRYIKCYRELTFGKRPSTQEEVVDYCVDRPILMAQVRSEILELGKIIKVAAPRRILEIGTNYGGTLFLLCTLSAPDAKIISLDLPFAAFGGGYPRRKIPLFRKFSTARQQLYLLRTDSHLPETKERILRILEGDSLDFLFIDADHTYAGVKRDFEMYAPLVRSEGIVAFHDIVAHKRGTDSEVDRFWGEVKRHYRHREIIEDVEKGAKPTAVTGASMDTAGLGVLYMP